MSLGSCAERTPLQILMSYANEDGQRQLETARTPAYQETQHTRRQPQTTRDAASQANRRQVEKTLRPAKAPFQRRKNSLTGKPVGENNVLDWWLSLSLFFACCFPKAT